MSLLTNMRKEVDKQYTKTIMISHRKANTLITEAKRNGLLHKN